MATAIITYSNIITRCKRLSAFEGKALVDGQGESRYAEIRLTDLENDLVKEYISEGLNLVEGALGGSVTMQIEYGGACSVTTKDASGNTTTETTADTASLELYSGTKEAMKTNGSLVKSIEETLSSYVMHRWLADKVADRSNAYKVIFTEMLDATKRIAWKRKRPTMET